MGHGLIAPTPPSAPRTPHHPHPYNRGWWWGVFYLHHPHRNPTHLRQVGVAQSGIGKGRPQAGSGDRRDPATIPGHPARQAGAAGPQRVSGSFRVRTTPARDSRPRRLRVFRPQKFAKPKIRGTIYADHY